MDFLYLPSGHVFPFRAGIYVKGRVSFQCMYFLSGCVSFQGVYFLSGHAFLVRVRVPQGVYSKAIICCKPLYVKVHTHMYSSLQQHALCLLPLRGRRSGMSRRLVVLRCLLVDVGQVVGRVDPLLRFRGAVGLPRMRQGALYMVGIMAGCAQSLETHTHSGCAQSFDPQTHMHSDCAQSLDPQTHIADTHM